MDNNQIPAPAKSSGKTGIIVGVIVVLLIIGAGYYIFSRPNSSGQGPMIPATTTSTSTSTTTTTTSNPQNHVVSYTNNGFVPQTLTIADGDSVTWVNNSTNELWVASAPHPIHNGYDGTTLQQHCAPGYAGPTPFDECAAIAQGGSYTFTFYQVGSWGYHNHMVDSDQGTIIVTAPVSTTTVNVNVTQ
jgi:plastocyanin